MPGLTLLERQEERPESTQIVELPGGEKEEKLQELS